MADENFPIQFVDIPGLANFRDIGGWPISDESGNIVAHVRKGVFYRGPDTAPIEPSGEAKLRELGITKDFDLRSKGQIVKAGGFKTVEGIERVGCPAFPDGEYSPDKAAARYVQYASDGTDVSIDFTCITTSFDTEILGEDLTSREDILSHDTRFSISHHSLPELTSGQGIVQAFSDVLTHGAPAARIILVHLASIPPDAPTACFIHCTTGNNRSGVFIGVILSLLHVPPALIAEEYSLSDIGLRPTRDKVVERLMKSPVFANAGGGGKERAERMVGARKESMLAMLEMVEKKWGGAEGYARDACGLSEEEVERIRVLLTVKETVEPKKRMSIAFSTCRKYFSDLWAVFG